MLQVLTCFWPFWLLFKGILQVVMYPICQEVSLIRRLCCGNKIFQLTAFVGNTFDSKIDKALGNDLEKV